MCQLPIWYNKFPTLKGSNFTSSYFYPTVFRSFLLPFFFLGSWPASHMKLLVSRGYYVECKLSFESKKEIFYGVFSLQMDWRDFEGSCLLEWVQYVLK